MKEMVVTLIRRYFHHRVGQTSASLAYYMLFSFFPFTVLIGKTMGLLNVSFSKVFGDLISIVPDEVLSIAKQNVNASYRNAWIPWVALAIYFLIRTTNVFLYSIERALQSSHTKKSLHRYISSFFLSLGIMIAMLIIVALILLSKNLLLRLSPLLSSSDTLLFIVHYGRFVIIALLIFAIHYCLYASGAASHIKHKDLLPGAVAGSCAWLLISMLFSWYVSTLGRYSLLYGSLSAVIVLLLWLHLSSLIIVMGAEFNGILLNLRHKE